MDDVPVSWFLNPLPEFASYLPQYSSCFLPSFTVFTSCFLLPIPISSHKLFIYLIKSMCPSSTNKLLLAQGWMSWYDIFFFCFTNVLARKSHQLIVNQHNPLPPPPLNYMVKVWKFKYELFFGLFIKVLKGKPSSLLFSWTATLL